MISLLKGECYDLSFAIYCGSQPSHMKKLGEKNDG